MEQIRETVGKPRKIIDKIQEKTWENHGTPLKMHQETQQKTIRTALSSPRCSGAQQPPRRRRRPYSVVVLDEIEKSHSEADFAAMEEEQIFFLGEGVFMVCFENSFCFCFFCKDFRLLLFLFCS